jgi:hypothetical protein
MYIPHLLSSWGEIWYKRYACSAVERLWVVYKLMQGGLYFPYCHKEWNDVYLNHKNHVTHTSR